MMNPCSSWGVRKQSADSPWTVRGPSVSSSWASTIRGQSMGWPCTVLSNPWCGHGAVCMDSRQAVRGARMGRP